MNYKVLITTSGIGQRLGELTKYTNKSLVTIGKKPILSYIIESYPKNVPFVITTGYFGNHIKEFVKLAYPDRKVEFVDIDKYQGPGTSLGYSMLQAKKKLNCPFIFHACDTITEGKIPAPKENWIGGYKGRDASQYASWNVLDKNQYILNEKGAIDFDYIHIGLIGIKDHKEFWSELENLYTQNPNDSTLNDCRVIVNMLKRKCSFDITEFKKWYDIGNTKALDNARQNIGDDFQNLHKLEESIFFLKNKVIKFFHDEKNVRDRVKRQGILKGLVPEKLNHTHNFYSYKYVEGELYSEVITPQDFKKFLTWTQKNLWIKKDEVGKNKFEEICYDFYYKKTQKRVGQFLETNNLKDTTHIINDEEVPTVQEMLSKIDFKELSKTEQYQFHGDFIIDNVIKTKKGYTLIDWRQHFGGLYESGDMYYDLAKLNHNLTINHDIIHHNLLSVKSDKDRIFCDINRKENLVQCQQVLREFIEKNGYNLKKVELLTSIIWLNMSPLHHYPFNIFLFYFGKLNLWRTIKKYQ